ncbi:MAG: hypothetical protein EDM05_66020 [Leptolyngbya sp. IPPAS B-1204]|nr:hypothetical protein [Elainella sp. C42_A2020_010]RNJ68287.1 MAG: hypothetical protein EDM05_14285 [Leptolyngbya sp. IPPAS B-1204]
MLKSNQRASLPWRTLVKQLHKPIAGLFVAAGLVAVGVPAPVQSSEAANSTERPSMADGVYLYGQSAEPNTVGSEYIVFEVSQGEVVGGFYMPNSSFDCFYGTVQADQLALTVIDSYEQTRHPYAVALASTGNVASAGNETAAPVGLEGYQRLPQLSEIDQRVLSTCKADHSR